MSQLITIKLTKIGPTAGPFTIYNQFDEIIAENITKSELIKGVSYDVEDNVSIIIVKSTSDCTFKKSKNITFLTRQEYADLKTSRIITGCVWRHLTNIQLYNSFYGKINPYIIEYPFVYKYQDEILQSVKDYTKSYKYLSTNEGVFNYNSKIETNTDYFNKAIIYNNQQSSGLLELVAKPLHNLQSYLSYPKYNIDSKTITYTKSDNLFIYNNFWSVNKSSQEALFTTPCTSLSYDKVINNNNMDYLQKSFKKAPIRAKDVKIRHILDDKNNIHLVSQFAVVQSQISYK